MVNLSTRAETSVWICKICCQHIHDQADQHILVFGVRFRHKEGQRGEAHIIDNQCSILSHQTAIPVQKVQKEQRRTAFVAIRKRMILDDEVQKVGGLGLDCRIGGLSKGALIQIAQDRQKAVPALLPEETSGLSAMDEVRLNKAMICRASSIVGNTPPSCPEGSVNRPSS